MKKQLLLLALLFSITTRFYATPIKKRLARVEEGVTFLAHNEAQSWQEIAYLNNQITNLEEKVYKKFAHPSMPSEPMKKKCHKKKKFKFDKFYDFIIDDTNID